MLEKFSAGLPIVPFSIYLANPAVVNQWLFFKISAFQSSWIETCPPVLLPASLRP